MTLVDNKHFEDMHAVMQHYLEGQTNPTTIANKTGLSRAVIVDCIQEFKELAKNSGAVQDRVLEIVKESEVFYSMLISKATKLSDEYEAGGNILPKDNLAALRLSADLQEKKLKAISALAEFDQGSLDEMIDLQNKLEAVEKMLIDLTGKFPETKTYIVSRLGEIDSTAEITKGD